MRPSTVIQATGVHCRTKKRVRVSECFRALATCLYCIEATVHDGGASAHRSAQRSRTLSRSSCRYSHLNECVDSSSSIFLSFILLGPTTAVSNFVGPTSVPGDLRGQAQYRDHEFLLIVPVCIAQVCFLPREGDTVLLRVADFQCWIRSEEFRCISHRDTQLTSDTPPTPMKNFRLLHRCHPQYP